jgi:hypothetical protein
MNGVKKMEKKELAKIAITPTADTGLVRALERINKDSTGGRVTKIELASWFILNGVNTLNDSAIEEIRLAHFSQVAYLESLIKSVKKTGREDLSPEELEKFQGMMKKISTQKKRANEVLLPIKKLPAQNT